MSMSKAVVQGGGNVAGGGVGGRAGGRVGGGLGGVTAWLLVLVAGGLAGTAAAHAAETARRGVVPTGLAQAAQAGELAGKQAHGPDCRTCRIDDATGGLAFFDVRLEDPLLVAASDVAQRQAADLARGDLLRLRAAVPGVAVDFDGILATPKFVRSIEGTLTGARAQAEPLAVIADFVATYPALAGVQPGLVRSARVDRDFVTEHSGVRHLTYQQTVDGMDLFGCIIRANIARDGALINFSSTMIDPGAGPAPFKLSAAEAVALAAADAGAPIAAPTLAPVPGSTREDAGERTTWINPPELRADEPVVTEKLVFPLTRGELRPAYSVLLPVPGGPGHTYEYVIDATDGAVLHRHNRLVCSQDPVSLRVFTGSSPAPAQPAIPLAPTGAQFPEVARTLVAVTPAQMGTASPDGWVTTGLTTTTGNNVAASTDLNNDNVLDTPITSGTVVSGVLTFDPALDLLQPPSSNADAAVTQMFYLSNLYHDKLYTLGFTEAARNFQLDNLGRGGTGNDRIQAEVQDGGGTNNANFSTGGSDGSTARVQMYVWSGPSPDRDGAFDADIVFHELTHGLSIRLHGGLSGTQPQGMGEGWSDFFGVCLNTAPTADPNGNFSTGGYATLQLGLASFTDNYYFGIRRFPYSTSFNRNPLTFADIDPGQFAVPGSVPRNPVIANGPSSVHQVGEVWCNTLLEMRAGLWAQYGFAANDLAMRLVVDGMKLSPGNPTFVQARDAIIAADQTTNGGANRVTIWNAFAKRGLGLSAVAPASNTSSGVVEAYDTPITAQFSYPDGLPTQLLPGQPTTIRVSIVGEGLSITPGTQTVGYRLSGGSISTAPMTSLGGSLYQATIPAQACNSRVEWYFSTGTDQGPRSDPAAALSSAVYYAGDVFSSVQLVFSDDFEINRGWTVGPNTATSGLWLRGDPIGTTAQPEDDRTPGAGVNCFFTGQGPAGSTNAGAADIDGGQTTLTSPAIDCSAFYDATVSYWRWYSNGLGGAPFADVFRVQVSADDGGNWVDAEVVGPTSSPDTQPGWRQASWSLRAVGVTPTATVRVRFIAEDAGTGSLVEAAIDDFTVSGRVCQSVVTACNPADVAGTDASAGPDGQVNNGDFQLFFSAFFAANCAQCGTQGAAPCGPADVATTDGTAGADGCVDNGDFQLFFTAFFAGCPGT